MNPIRALKLYLRWKPEIEEAEGAVADAERGGMRGVFNKVLLILEPICWAASGGAVTSLADYMAAPHQLNVAEMKSVALAGAAAGLTAYFRQPRKAGAQSAAADK